ncbi:hypothetical protein K2173_009452 [Erythroxylum novogranatense]|uniref:Uncharacterized protein n=1 Tax=Erythroxylum novogranatense TaxID=1862640 RepID=A0AAV8U405_9ROSI|nr:hypothetical protein K2173_009452 [Erythroxylum novogranatense]
MEPPQEPENRKMGLRNVVLRLSLVILLPIFAFFFLSFSIVVVAVLGGHVTISYPFSIPSQCRIVSSSVDLRFSKICELGVLNYKAKNVFHPFERSKFRCHYDYYWASVFEVEYRDRSLGRRYMALAETPDEALPLNCRPSFGAAWLTKNKFKVNKTYDCWYTSDISKVSLYRDDIFGCGTKDSFSMKIIRHYFTQFTNFAYSLFRSKKGSATYWRWEAIAGAVSGFITSVISISLIRIFQLIIPWLHKTYVAAAVARTINTVFLKRVCFLVAYFSVMGWFAIQYGKRLGLSEIYRVYNY